MSSPGRPLMLLLALATGACSRPQKEPSTDYLDGAPPRPWPAVLAIQPVEEFPLLDLEPTRIRAGKATLFLDENSRVTKRVGWAVSTPREIDRRIWDARDVQHSWDVRGNYVARPLPRSKCDQNDGACSSRSLALRTGPYDVFSQSLADVSHYVLWDPRTAEDVWRLELPHANLFRRSISENVTAFSGGGKTHLVSWSERRILAELEGEMARSWDSPAPTFLTRTADALVEYDENFARRQSWKLPPDLQIERRSPGVYLAVGSQGVFEFETKSPRVRRLAPAPRDLEPSASANGCTVGWWARAISSEEARSVPLIDYCQTPPRELLRLEVTGHGQTDHLHWLEPNELLLRTSPTELTLVHLRPTGPEVSRGQLEAGTIVRHSTVDSDTILVIGPEGALSGWDTKSAKITPWFASTRVQPLREAAFLFDDRTLAVSDSTRDWSRQRGGSEKPAFVALLDLKLGRIAATRRHSSSISPLNDRSALSFSGPRTEFPRDETEHLWKPWLGAPDLSEPKPLRSERHASIQYEADVAFNLAHGVTVGIDQKKLAWITQGDGFPRGRTLDLDTPAISVALSGDARLLATLHLGGQIQLRQIEGMKSSGQLALPAPVEFAQLALDHTGQLLVASVHDGAYLFDVRRRTWLHLQILEKDGQFELYAEHERGWLQAGPLALEGLRRSAPGVPPDATAQRQIVSTLVRDFVARALTP